MRRPPGERRPARGPRRRRREQQERPGPGGGRRHPAGQRPGAGHDQARPGEDPRAADQPDRPGTAPGGRARVPGRPPPFRLRGQRRPARRGGGAWPLRCARRAGAAPRRWSTTPSRCSGRGSVPPPDGLAPTAVLLSRPAARRSGTGGSRSPAGRASTASASRRTGGRPGSSRSASITGDWGGGHGLGLAALWWAMRAEDGRGPETALRGAVAAHFGVPSVREVAIGIHLGTISEAALAGAGPGACWRSRAPAMTSPAASCAGRPTRSARWR